MRRNKNKLIKARPGRKNATPRFFLHNLATAGGMMVVTGMRLVTRNHAMHISPAKLLILVEAMLTKSSIGAYLLHFRSAMARTLQHSIVQCRWLAWMLTVLLTIGQTNSNAQRPVVPTAITNGGFEEVAETGVPSGWNFPSEAFAKVGYKLQMDQQEGIEKSQAPMLFSTGVVPPKAACNLTQTIDPTALRGKRVRFRAAVRTADLDKDGKALLWFLVECGSGTAQRRFSAVDNMENRPIQNSEWKHYDIVGNVDAEATVMRVGLILAGQGKAWMDDATLEVVPNDTPTTTQESGSAQTTKGSTTAPPTNGVTPTSSSQRVNVGPTTRADSQPFFVKWLWLVLVGLVLMGLSQIKPRSDKRLWVSIQGFAFRFSFIYWILYSLTNAFRALPWMRTTLGRTYLETSGSLARWVSLNVFDITQLPIPNTGSGDTMDAYVGLLVCFVIAMLAAMIWSLIDRRRALDARLNDLLRTYLRYVLAFMLLGYGLGKAGQYPPLGFDQLITTFGDSTPMGVLWKFMKASQPYTVFAAICEVGAAVLLLWRRTSVLGAMAAAGVMLNVAMMNFCYDVPVKQFSSHLCLMALFIMLPEAQRLANVLFWNRPTEAVNLRPMNLGVRGEWGMRIVKACVVVYYFGLPIMQSVTRPKAPDLSDSGVLGGYEIESANNPRQWRYLSLQRQRGTNTFTLGLQNGIRESGTFEFEPDGRTMQCKASFRMNTTQAMTVRVMDADHLNVAAEGIEVGFKRKRRDSFTLIKRGFHWTTELPYNG